MKWVCFFLIAAGLSSDVLSDYYSSHANASGVVSSLDTSHHEKVLSLKVTKGTIHPGEFIVAEKYSGTISKVTTDDKGNKTVYLHSVEGNYTNNSSFKTYSNLWFLNIYQLIESSLILFIFYFIFRQKKWKRIVLITVALLLFTWLYQNILMDNLYTLDDFNAALGTVFIIFFSIVFFYFQLRNTEDLFVYASFPFWIVSALLIYKAGTFFLFLYFNTLDPHEQENMYYINFIFYILRNILFAVSFIIQKDNSKPFPKNIRR